MSDAVAPSAASVIATVASETRRQQAEGRLRVIRNALKMADEELAAAYAARDWEAFDLPSWAAYCAELLPELQHIKLRAPVRRERAAELYAAGASEKDVALATGSSIGTAHNDAVALGHSKMSADASPTQESRADQIVRLVASRGVRGATSPEVARMARCSQGAASGCLSRLHGQGRVRPTREQRGGFGIYVAPGN